MKDWPPAPGGCFWASTAFDSSAPTKSKTNKRNSWQRRTRGELPEKQVGARSNNHREEDEHPADEATSGCVTLTGGDAGEVWDASLASHNMSFAAFGSWAAPPPTNKWKNSSFKPFGLEFFLNFNQNRFHDAPCLYRLEEPDKKDKKKCFCKSLKNPFEFKQEKL